MPQEEARARSKAQDWASRAKLSSKPRAAAAGCIPTQSQQFTEDPGNIQQQEDANPCSRLLSRAAAGISQPLLPPEMGFVTSAPGPPRAGTIPVPGLPGIQPGHTRGFHSRLAAPQERQMRFQRFLCCLGGCPGQALAPSSHPERYF